MGEQCHQEPGLSLPAASLALSVSCQLPSPRCRLLRWQATPGNFCVSGLYLTKGSTC